MPGAEVGKVRSSDTPRQLLQRWEPPVRRGVQPEFVVGVFRNGPPVICLDSVYPGRVTLDPLPSFRRWIPLDRELRHS